MNNEIYNGLYFSYCFINLSESFIELFSNKTEAIFK